MKWTCELSPRRPGCLRPRHNERRPKDGRRGGVTYRR